MRSLWRADHLSPPMVAAKALGMGTLLACGGFGAMLWGTMLYLDAHNVDEFSAAMRQRVPKLSQAIEQTIAPLKHNLQTAFEKAGPSTDDSSNLASGLSDILKSRIPQLSVSIENKIRPVRDGLSSVFSRFAPTPKVNSDLVGGEDDQGDKP